MRLLIIEDDRADADYMARAFRELGHSADLAADGEDGLAHALTGKYDVIIVDRRLPKLDGLAVIGALRSKGIKTPALILSALGQIDDQRAAGGRQWLYCPSLIRFQSCWRAQRSWRGPGRPRGNGLSRRRPRA